MDSSHRPEAGFFRAEKGAGYIYLNVSGPFFTFFFKAPFLDLLPLTHQVFLEEHHGGLPVDIPVFFLAVTVTFVQGIHIPDRLTQFTQSSDDLQRTNQNVGVK